VLQLFYQGGQSRDQGHTGMQKGGQLPNGQTQIRGFNPAEQIPVPGRNFPPIPFPAVILNLIGCPAAGTLGDPRFFRNPDHQVVRR